MSNATSAQSTDGDGAGDFRGDDPWPALFASTASVAKMHPMKRLLFISVVVSRLRKIKEGCREAIRNEIEKEV